VAQAITRNGQPDEITVTPEYVRRSLSRIDGLDAHEGPISTQNIEDLITTAREFAKGYAEHAAILKHVIADRERIRGERNTANEELHRSREQLSEAIWGTALAAICDVGGK
jgi:hypothetical protein